MKKDIKLTFEEREISKKELNKALFQFYFGTTDMAEILRIIENMKSA
ncbi:hypothetical protein [uncultured Thomasclavelia sp.]|nr:hypothetical protein [uncultured Thomasclavelia sp.]